MAGDTTMMQAGEVLAVYNSDGDTAYSVIVKIRSLKWWGSRLLQPQLY